MESKFSKDFQSKRSLKAGRNKETLVARAFAAWEIKVPISKTSVQLDKEKKRAMSILKFSNDVSSIILSTKLLLSFPISCASYFQCVGIYAPLWLVHLQISEFFVYSSK